MILVYILELADQTHYAGLTAYLLKRLNAHLRGQSRSTRRSPPIALRYLRAFTDRKAARRFELYIKRHGPSRFLRESRFKSQHQSHICNLPLSRQFLSNFRCLHYPPTPGTKIAPISAPQSTISSIPSVISIPAEKP